MGRVTARCGRLTLMCLGGVWCRILFNYTLALEDYEVFAGDVESRKISFRGHKWILGSLLLPFSIRSNKNSRAFAAR